MTYLKKIRTFFSLDIGTLILFVEASLYLGWARILICMPFSKITSSLGVERDETPLTVLENKEILKRVANAIDIMSNHMLWECKCLVRAIAALKMLERRKVECTLYLGTAKDESGNMIAHAWLRSGPFYITGAEGMERFTVVGSFANRVQSRKKGASSG